MREQRTTNRQPGTMKGQLFSSCLTSECNLLCLHAGVSKWACGWSAVCGPPEKSDSRKCMHIVHGLPGREMLMHNF